MNRPGGRQAVLVVDDEPLILRSMAGLLEEDFSVITSTNAEEGLRLLEKTEISVIIADQRMPGLTGDEFLAKARELSAAARILITGYSDINALVRAVNHGQIYTYMAKPWEPEQLRMTVVKAAEHCMLAREAVRERNLLHALMNNIPDAIWFKDSAGRVTDLNKAAAAFLGLSDPALAIGKEFSHFLAQEESGKIESREQRIVRLKRAENNHIDRFDRKSSGIRWISTTTAPIVEGGGEESAVVTGLVGVSRDITDQKYSELALRRSEERYRQIVETTTEGVWIFNEQLETLFVNSRMAGMLGCDVEEMMGRPISPFLKDDESISQLRHLSDRQAGAITEDLRLKKKNGAEIRAMISSSPLLDSSGHRRGTLAMLTDVTERKALEEQFRQAQKLEALGRFAGGVAHDFNNVLTLITGYSQLLLRSLDAGSPLRGQVEKIATAVDQGTHVTRQILSFSRQRVVNPKVLDLNKVVTRFEEMCHPILNDDVELVTKLAPAGAHVRADAGQLDQILMNLAVNARDAMPRGGALAIETSSIELDAGSARRSGDKPPGPYVRLTVSDTGTGMNAETRKRVFEPFFTTKAEGKGTGLGLATVHGIVTQHGGWLELKSEPGQGTCFSIFLPQVTKEIDAVPSSEVPEQKAQWVRGSETILAVDDRAALRELTRETLELCGYNVLEAGNGREGLDICERHPEIDLVLTDLTMPGMGGLEFVKLLRAMRPQMKVLYMSATDGDTPVGEEALIQKPFKPEALSRKIRELLDARGAARSILIADDNDEIRALLRSVFENEGYRVFTAENGKKAVAILKEAPVNLMVTDLVMPEQEGIETIIQARKDYPNLRIVAISGLFAGVILNGASHLGADAIVEKPLQIDELLKVVRKLLGQNEQAVSAARAFLSSENQSYGSAFSSVRLA